MQRPTPHPRSPRQHSAAGRAAGARQRGAPMQAGQAHLALGGGRRSGGGSRQGPIARRRQLGATAQVRWQVATAGAIRRLRSRWLRHWGSAGRRRRRRRPGLARRRRRRRRSVVGVPAGGDAALSTCCCPTSNTVHCSARYTNMIYLDGGWHAESHSLAYRHLHCPRGDQRQRTLQKSARRALRQSLARARRCCPSVRLLGAPSRPQHSAPGARGARPWAGCQSCRARQRRRVLGRWCARGPPRAPGGPRASVRASRRCPGCC